MNFSSHINRLRSELRNCLSGDRREIVAGLMTCTERAQSLLGNAEFDFWIKQMRCTEPDDIPMTVHGLKLVQGYLRANAEGAPNSRQTLANEISCACEGLLTYMRDGDDCPMQSDFHYYFHEAENVVFKKSELGWCTLPKEVSSADPEQIRIARLSELDVKPSELVR